jgi:hypothetical protein
MTRIEDPHNLSAVGGCGYEKMTTRQLIVSTLSGDDSAFYFLMNFHQCLGKSYYDHLYYKVLKLAGRYDAERHFLYLLDSLYEKMREDNWKALRSFKGQPRDEEGNVVKLATDKVFDKTFYNWFVNQTAYHYFIRTLVKLGCRVKCADYEKALAVMPTQSNYRLNYKLAVLYDAITRLDDEVDKIVALCLVNDDDECHSTNYIVRKVNEYYLSRGMEDKLATVNNINARRKRLRAKLKQLMCQIDPCILE